jgi:hypothetical protein
VADLCDSLPRMQERDGLRFAPEDACSSSTAVVCDGVMHALVCRGKGAARRANRDRARCRRSGGVLTEMVVVQALAPRTFTARRRRESPRRRRSGDSTAMRPLARRVSGIVSVGLTAIALVSDT